MRERPRATLTGVKAPSNGVVVGDLRVLLQLAPAVGSVFGEFFDAPRWCELSVHSAATGRPIVSHEFRRWRHAERARQRFVAEADRRGLTARDDAEVRELLREVTANR
jgi:hypothetical protein